MKKLAISLAVLFLFVAQPLAAQSWTSDDLPGAPANEGEIQYNGHYEDYIASVGGKNVYVGPYYGSVSLAGGGTLSPASLYCVDFAHTIRSGQSWNVYATRLVDGADLSNTYLGEGVHPFWGSFTTDWTNFNVYKRAAYFAALFSQVEKSKANWTAIHGTIWAWMNPDLLGLDPENPANPWGEEFEVLMADAGDYTFNPANWYILSDVNGEGQEFLVRVPEPGTLVLLLGGLLGIVILAHRRVREDLA
jgi:hypothetical protein